MLDVVRGRGTHGLLAIGSLITLESEVPLYLPLNLVFHVF